MSSQPKMENKEMKDYLVMLRFHGFIETKVRAGDEETAINVAKEDSYISVDGGEGEISTIVEWSDLVEVDEA